MEELTVFGADCQVFLFRFGHALVSIYPEKITVVSTNKYLVRLEERKLRGFRLVVLQKLVLHFL